MREHPLGTVVSVDSQGQPCLSYLPLHLDERASGLYLLGHCARANPQADLLAAQGLAVVSFLGPQAYQSPSVYPDEQRVPTWNYLSVQCRVQVRMLDALEDKDVLLKALIHDHEPAYAAQWARQDPGWAEAMLRGIAAFEMRVVDLQAKFKLNQHRPESHAAMHRGYSASEREDERQLAHWMERLGLVARPEGGGHTA